MPIVSVARVPPSALVSRCNEPAWSAATWAPSGNASSSASPAGRTARARASVWRSAAGMPGPLSSTRTIAVPAERQRLVQRFARGPDSTGTGLGLALVAQVATLHGGSLHLDASPLGGTRATLTIGTPVAH